MIFLDQDSQNMKELFNLSFKMKKIKIKEKLFKKYYSIVFLILVSFFSGFIFRPYFSKIKKPIISILENNFYKKYSYKCPDKISSVPENSIAIIGHAYGSHENSNLRGNIEIAPKVKNFYLLNKKNINTIIFSGDVLKEPSIKKWENFFSDFNNETDIYIAPGNHDVGHNIYDSAARDIFKTSNNKNYKDVKFPFKLYLNESLFIIADTNAKKESIEQIYSYIESEKFYKQIFVVMHHVLPRALKNSANAPAKHGFIDNQFFQNKSNKTKDKKIIFLYGDGGAFKNKPRISCIKIANTYHIVNGIGEIKGDNIIIINKNKIYRMEV